MSYIITRSDGTTTLTITDATLNTATSVGLPGRNYASYGNAQNTSLVHIMENFANTTPPVNAMIGQTWFDTGSNTLYACAIEGSTTPSNWIEMSKVTSAGTTTFGNISVTNDATVLGLLSFASGSGTDLTVGNVTATVLGTFADANVGNLLTRVITTGANVTTGNITGTWTLTTGSKLQATYADLAERFEADSPYSPGTVVELGGPKEVVACADELSESVFGVVSSTAGYLMNCGAGTDITHPAIAVSGRVYVNVQGSIRKGQRLVSAGSGRARAALPGEASAFNVIGRSLSDKETTGLGTVEAFVTIR